MSIHEFTCKDCRRTFKTAEEFSDHFTREEGTTIITGCKQAERKEREA